MKRILIVEDQEGFLDELVDVLAEAHPDDWKLFAAGTVQEALHQFRAQYQKSEPIDMLLTDLNFPEDELGGLHIIEESRVVDPDILAILFTGHQHNRLETLRSFAYDVIEKAEPGTDVSAEEILLKTERVLKLREDEKLLKLILPSVDPRVQSILRENPGQLKLSSQRVAITLWEMSGFLRLTDVLAGHTKLVSRFLTDYYTAATDQVHAHEGVIIDFFGDCVMAMFGWPNTFDPDDDDAERIASAESASRAVQAGLELRTDFQALLRKHGPNWPRRTNDPIQPLDLRCAVNTGTALVGRIGSDRRQKFAAVGTDVNFTARLVAEAGKAEHKFLVSQTTEAHLPASVARRPFRILRDANGNQADSPVFEILPNELALESRRLGPGLESHEKGEMSGPNSPRKVFISYSHKDREHLDRLQVHLKPLEHVGMIERWDDTSIRSGMFWLDEIQKALASADVAVLLVSADFLASDFIRMKEMPDVLSAEVLRGLVVIPVILKPCRFSQTTMLAKFQAVNPDMKPLVMMDEGEQEALWSRLARDVEAALSRSMGSQKNDMKEIQFQ